jgi:N6-adenosine-specific RNA methylase IME4
VSFEHHAVVASLPDEWALPLLRWCRDTDPTPTIQQLRTRTQQVRRDEREEELGSKISALPDKLYGVLYADPPWRLEPYSRDTGLNRAADNHYPTMTLDEIIALEVPAADDCVLFLWATVPMLVESLEVMTAWDFEYRSHVVWPKDSIGTGYWFRNQHELLLVGVRGEVPAPAPGTQFPSVMPAPREEHSAKPAIFAEMIETMFPSLPRLELFARRPRDRWEVWGNET